MKRARRSKKRRAEFDGLTEGHAAQIIRRKSITRVKKSRKKFDRKRLKRQGLPD